MSDLKANIETLAKEENKTPLEIITLLQAAAAAIGDDEQLEELCNLKWDYIS